MGHGSVVSRHSTYLDNSRVRAAQSVPCLVCLFVCSAAAWALPGEDDHVAHQMGAKLPSLYIAVVHDSVVFQVSILWGYFLGSIVHSPRAVTNHGAWPYLLETSN
ncbi:hypothetical protein E4U54_008329 [Claviceps lovelessii]|nr:hypothetical protein E4U54_008329 [Claviceps lovelessii]